MVIQSHFSTPEIQDVSQASMSVYSLSLAISDKNRLYESLLQLGSPYKDLETYLVSLYPVFAMLPVDILKALLDFRDNPNAPGFLLLTNLPCDQEIPATPSDTSPVTQKPTFVSEGCLLGLAQILGGPLGYHDERAGAVIQNLYPVVGSNCDTSSESWEIELGFHTDFNFNKLDPTQPFNQLNPDYIVLVGLRRDPQFEAYTMYADARDICRHLHPEDVALLRQPLFQFAASYSFSGRSGDERLWSSPTAMLSGSRTHPEISIDMLCGVRGISECANELLRTLARVCFRPDVMQRVSVGPGDALLIDNRKGAHARTAFTAHMDGRDRWLQRTYARRSFWELRNLPNATRRVF